MTMSPRPRSAQAGRDKQPEKDKRDQDKQERKDQKQAGEAEQAPQPGPRQAPTVPPPTPEAPGEPAPAVPAAQQPYSPVLPRHEPDPALKKAVKKAAELDGELATYEMTHQADAIAKSLRSQASRLLAQLTEAAGD